MSTVPELEEYESLKNATTDSLRDSGHVRIVDGEVFVNARVMGSVQNIITEYATKLYLGGQPGMAEAVAAAGLVSAGFNEAVARVADELEPGIVQRLLAQSAAV